MDRITNDAFFDILKAAIWQREPHISSNPEGINMEELITEFKNHALLGVVADVMGSHFSFADEQLDCIYRYMGNMMQRHWELDNMVTEVFDRLEAESIQPVLLKGQGLARLYPMPNTRSVGDIDIYTGKANYVRAQKIIDKYCGMPEREVYLNPSTIHGTCNKADIKFEIHYLCADTAIPSIKEEYNAFMDGLILNTDETIEINEKKIRVPQPTVNMIYVFEHLLKHFRYEGVGFRQFIDWMLTIRQWRDRGSIDEEWIKETLMHFHLMDAWQVLGGILVYQLGLPEREFPFWKASKAKHSQGRNLKYIMDSENLGHGTAKSKGYYYMPPSGKRKWLAFCYYARFTMFEYRVFPYDTLRKVLHRVFC